MSQKIWPWNIFSDFDELKEPEDDDTIADDEDTVQEVKEVEDIEDEEEDCKDDTVKEVSGNSSESQEGSVQEGHKKSSSSFENDSLNSSDADAIFGDCKGQSNLEPPLYFQLAVVNLNFSW